MLLTFILSGSARVTTGDAGRGRSARCVWSGWRVTTTVSLVFDGSAWARPGTASRPRESRIVQFKEAVLQLHCQNSMDITLRLWGPDSSGRVLAKLPCLAVPEAGIIIVISCSEQAG